MIDGTVLMRYDGIFSPRRLVRWCSMRRRIDRSLPIVAETSLKRNRAIFC